MGDQVNTNTIIVISLLFITGYKELKQNLIGPARAQYYKFSDLRMINPFVNDWYKVNLLKTRYQERKARIFMRGVKVGKRVGGSSHQTGMTLFEMGNKKAMATPAGAQKASELQAKATMSDETLGLTRDS
jgi:hypothetical protein